MKYHLSPRALMAHAILITYTLIALLPVVLVVMNSFKSRKAIFGAPLALPTPQTFDLVGYVAVFNQGNFFAYFQNSLIVTTSCCCLGPWRLLPCRNIAFAAIC